MPAKGQRLPDVERFTALYVPEPNSGCWLWLGGVGRGGYGKFWASSQTHDSAHRASWKIHHGEIPDGIFVCHKCDTPLCVNPSHLFLGRPVDNTQDMMAKGRDRPVRQSRRGTMSNFARLSPEQVLTILADTRPQSKIAADYGITQTGVSRIKLRKVWRHLDANP